MYRDSPSSGYCIRFAITSRANADWTLEGTIAIPPPTVKIPATAVMMRVATNLSVLLSLFNPPDNSFPRYTHCRSPNTEVYDN